MEIRQRAFEETIGYSLLQNGPDAGPPDARAVLETPPAFGDSPPGGYHKRRDKDHDRALCFLPNDVVDFVLATQPKEWQKLSQHHGASVKERFVKRLVLDRQLQTSTFAFTATPKSKTLELLASVAKTGDSRPFTTTP
jgi:hypothetical protein